MSVQFYQFMDDGGYKKKCYISVEVHFYNERIFWESLDADGETSWLGMRRAVVSFGTSIII